LKQSRFACRPIVVASGAKQSMPSFRGDAKHY
jgi:hypothetical protein